MNGCIKSTAAASQPEECVPSVCGSLAAAAAAAAAKGTHTHTTTCNTKTFLLLCETLTHNNCNCNCSTTQVKSPVWPFDLSRFEPVEIPDEGLMGFEWILFLQDSKDLLLLGKTQQRADRPTNSTGCSRTHPGLHPFQLTDFSNGNDPTWSLSVNGINFDTSNTWSVHLQVSIGGDLTRSMLLVLGYHNVRAVTGLILSWYWHMGASGEIRWWQNRKRGWNTAW